NDRSWVIFGLRDHRQLQSRTILFRRRLRIPARCSCLVGVSPNCHKVLVPRCARKVTLFVRSNLSRVETSHSIFTRLQVCDFVSSINFLSCSGTGKLLPGVLEALWLCSRTTFLMYSGVDQ